MKILYKIDDDKSVDITAFLKENYSFSSSYISMLKKISSIKVNNNILISPVSLKYGDIIEIDLDNVKEESENIVPTEMNLNILYEDDFIIAINKTSNLPVHPSILHYENTLSNGVQYYYLEKGLKTKIRPVNRLDKDTSGIVVFAKYPFIQNNLARQMKDGSYVKKYLGVVEGIFSPDHGVINAPIIRKEGSIIERTVDLSCKIESAQAITHYKTLKSFNKYSLVEYSLETGRTHQIRVHSAYMFHPLLGDTLYGNSSSLINRQALHCYNISFTHPINKKPIELSAPLPEDMERLLK